MKNYIKMGFGIYIGWQLAKAADKILTDIFKTRKADTTEAAGGETMNGRNEE